MPLWRFRLSSLVVDSQSEGQSTTTSTSLLKLTTYQQQSGRKGIFPEFLWLFPDSWVGFAVAASGASG